MNKLGRLLEKIKSNTHSYIHLHGSSCDLPSEYTKCKSWIEYYSSQKWGIVPKVCPCCKTKPSEENPFVGGHVVRVIEGKPIDTNVYITPICDRCNKEAKIESAFSILDLYVVKHPDPATCLKNINVNES